jgi:tRNA 2-(methylsulfanyl)-N6-isopentenyladenosine37 hydroxylase
VIALAPSSDAWVAAALADLPTLLTDHAHCEKKAAHTAIRFLFRFPEWPALVSAMSKLAREELVHFDRVLAELRRREVPFRQLQSANYAAELFRLVQSPVDELLCCALIEARSHERFERLIAALDGDPPLRALYADLAEAEARHGDIYLDLAAGHAGRDLAARLAELAAKEAEIIARPGQPVRMHAGGGDGLR